MADYQLLGSGVLRNSDGAVIPADEQNGDYFAYLQWVADGNTADPIPGPTLPEQASAELATRLGNGIAITCTGNGALTATYALDDDTMAQIGSVARDAGAGLGLPGGGGTFTYPDKGGTPRTFTDTQLIATYRAMRDLIFGLTSQSAVMAHGGSPSWPSQSQTIP